MLVHIAGLFFGFFALVFVYLASNDDFTKKNAANALNWHLPMSVVAIVVVMLGVWVSEPAGLAMGVSIAIATVCFSLIAGVKAYRGHAWKYPVVPQLL